MLLTDEEVARSTIEHFNAEGESWAANDANERGEQSDDLVEIACRLSFEISENPLFLILGCGYGREIDLLAKYGVSKSIGIDASRKMLDIAGRRYPDRDFRHGNIYDVKTIVNEQCDGFLCSCVLMQIPRLRVGPLFANLRAVLKENAVGVIETPSGSKKHKIRVGPHRVLLQQWESDELTELLEDHGFEVEFVHEQHEMIFLVVRAG